MILRPVYNGQPSHGPPGRYLVFDFADLVNRAFYRNETTILLKNGVAVAHIAPGAPTGVSAREAEVLDPQHRLFLESCWHAMENAGQAPGRGKQRVGVFAGAKTSAEVVLAWDPAREQLRSDLVRVGECAIAVDRRDVVRRDQGRILRDLFQHARVGGAVEARR